MTTAETAIIITVVLTAGAFALPILMHFLNKKKIENQRDVNVDKSIDDVHKEVDEVKKMIEIHIRESVEVRSKIERHASDIESVEKNLDDLKTELKDNSKELKDTMMRFESKIERLYERIIKWVKGE